MAPRIPVVARRLDYGHAWKCRIENFAARKFAGDRASTIKSQF
jgi:hypothetical protein